MSELKPEPMHQYEVVINGVVHTFQMDAEDAKRYPGAKKVGRSQVSLVDPVATSGQQVHEGSTSRAAGQAEPVRIEDVQGIQMPRNPDAPTTPDAPTPTSSDDRAGQSEADAEAKKAAAAESKARSAENKARSAGENKSDDSKTQTSPARASAKTK